MFEHMKLVTLRASYIAEQDGELPPYLGSTIRGLLGHSIRSFDCTYTKNKCFLCGRRTECIYARCFCSTGNAGGAVNPFVIFPHTTGKTMWKKGEICTFDLTIIGEITGQSAVFLDALREMEKLGWGARRLSFRLTRIEDPVSNTLVYCADRLWMRNLKIRPLSCTEKVARAALVIFDTPTRIVTGNKELESIPFSVLIRSIGRRIALLSQGYCGQVPELNDEIYALAGQVKTADEVWNRIEFRRYSMNQKEGKLELPAVTGWALYEGELDLFTPILEAGRWLHVGKNSTHGFGHFDVMYDR